MERPDNPVEELRKTAFEKRAVFVIGTGISIAASTDPNTGTPHPEASWGGLLKNGLGWLKDHRLIDTKTAQAQLTLLDTAPETHRFISVAQDVTKGMGGIRSPHYTDWLKRTVGSIKAHKRDTLDALEALRAHGNLLATTNYDGLLLDAEGKLSPVTWKEPEAFIRTARYHESDKILFLHGYWRQPETVILDWTSYDQIVRDDQYRDNLATFWKMTTWVYVGCGMYGLSDPDFGLLLERYGSRARQAGFWDFCLVRGIEQQRDFQAYFDTKELNICAVSFGEEYDNLPEFLNSLILPPTPVVSPAAPSPPSIPVPSAESKIGKTNITFNKKLFISIAIIVFTFIIISGFFIYRKFFIKEGAPIDLQSYERQMILIKKGSFDMGSDDEDVNKAHKDHAKPVHRVNLDNFYIGRTEVTVAMYKEYCKATGRDMPKPKTPWTWYDDHPMVWVSWQDCKEYIDWANTQFPVNKFKLPSEEQWEYAARGTENRVFPWGNSWNRNYCNNSLEKRNPNNKKFQTSPVGFYPHGNTPEGISDMAGNAWEWCDGEYKDYSTGKVINKDNKVVRGGSWIDDAEVHFKCANRGIFNFKDSDERRGFRMVMENKPIE